MPADTSYTAAEYAQAREIAESQAKVRHEMFGAGPLDYDDRPRHAVTCSACSELAATIAKSLACARRIEIDRCAKIAAHWAKPGLDYTANEDPHQVARDIESAIRRGVVMG